MINNLIQSFFVDNIPTHKQLKYINPVIYNELKTH